MLGQLGDIPLSASAQANQVFFIVSLAVAGIADGANVMVSQAWGAKDTARIQNILSYTYRLALGFVFVLTFAAILFPEWIMRIYTPDPEVITAGAEYLRIVAFSYLFYTVTTVSTGVLRAVRTVRIAMYGSLISMGLNVLLNWVLIFGKFGFAPMGVKGNRRCPHCGKHCNRHLSLYKGKQSAHQSAHAASERSDCPRPIL